jgi:hypothetical protein
MGEASGYLGLCCTVNRIELVFSPQVLSQIESAYWGLHGPFDAGPSAIDDGALLGTSELLGRSC